MFERLLHSTWHRQSLFFFLLWLVFGLASYGWCVQKGTRFHATPGETHDDVYYDNIAFSLANGKGFRLDFADAEFKRPYQATNRNHVNKWLIMSNVEGPTTSRAVAYPFLLSKSYQIFGRTWLVPRIANILMISFGLAVLVTTVGTCFKSPLFCLIATTTLCLDLEVLAAARHIGTEPLAVLAIALTYASIILAWRKQRTLLWFSSGILFGIAILVRPQLNAWLLLIGAATITGSAIALAINARSSMWKTQSSYLFAQRFFLFALGAVVVASPWWIRNCYVSNGFEPFGSAGKLGWVGGYSDAAIELKGNWSLTESVQQQADIFDNLSVEEQALSVAEQEHLIGKASFQSGMNWLKNNLTQLPALMFMKGASHLGFNNDLPPWVELTNFALILSGLIGFGLSWRRFGVWATIVMALSLATTMLTWAHYGRYSIPVRPLIHIGSAVTGTYLLTWLFSILGHAGSVQIFEACKAGDRRPDESAAEMCSPAADG